MITARVLAFIAAVCLGFAAWFVHVHPSASYEPAGNTTSAVAVKSETCPSVWDRWIDDLPPVTFPESQRALYEYGPTTALIKQRTCDSSIVGREHVSENWLAGAIILLFVAFYLMKSRLVKSRRLTEFGGVRYSTQVDGLAEAVNPRHEFIDDGDSEQGTDTIPSAGQ